MSRVTLTPEDVTNVGAPWWLVAILVVIGPVLGVVGTIATVWVSRRRDKASNEQMMIDQLQEQVSSLRRDLTELQADVRLLRVREIGWISYTQQLVAIISAAGLTAPAMPEELKSTPAAVATMAGLA